MSSGRFCSVCGSWHTEHGARCAIHARQDSKQRTMRTKRDGRSTAAWQRTRTAVLERDNHTCQRCGAHATSVHRLEGGWHDNELDAYHATCARCHGALHGGHRSAVA